MRHRLGWVSVGMALIGLAFVLANELWTHEPYWPEIGASVAASLVAGLAARHTRPGLAGLTLCGADVLLKVWL